MGGDTNGLTLGRYTILREIASGGMATVYLARQEGPVGFSKPVALKRMHPHIAKDPDFSTMFYDEATLAARIQHPNVVATLDVVAHEGEVFIVMEYVDGGSLATMIRDRKRKRIQVDVGIAVAITCEVLAGLHAAHEATSDTGRPLKIVHRDISPQNVLIGRDGLARVVDFGVAKAAVRSGVTKDQGVKGKLCYMSPEQVSGHEVDHRADAFAAAAVLFELLAGRRLFRGDDPGALIGAVLQARVPRLGDFRPDVPADVEAAMRKALEPNPDDRFPTALAFADALEDAVAKLPSRRRISAWVEERAIEVAHRRAYREAKRKAEAATAAEEAASAPHEALPNPSQGPTGEGGTAVIPDPRLHHPSIAEPIVDRISDPGPEPENAEDTGDSPVMSTGDTGGSGHHTSGAFVATPISSGPVPSERAPSESIKSEMMATPYSEVSLAAGTSVSLPSPPMHRGRVLAVVGAAASLFVVIGALAWIITPSEGTGPSESSPSSATTTTPAARLDGADEPDEPPPPAPTTEHHDETPDDPGPTSSASSSSSSAPLSASSTVGTAKPKRPSNGPPTSGTTPRPPPRPPPGGTYLPDMP